MLACGWFGKQYIILKPECFYVVTVLHWGPDLQDGWTIRFHRVTALMICLNWHHNRCNMSIICCNVKRESNKWIKQNCIISWAIFQRHFPSHFSNHLLGYFLTHFQSYFIAISWGRHSLRHSLSHCPSPSQTLTPESLPETFPEPSPWSISEAIY